MSSICSSRKKSWFITMGIWMYSMKGISSSMVKVNSREVAPSSLGTSSQWAL